MLKGNQYQIWVLDGSSDLMKVVTGLGEAGKFLATLKEGTIAKILFSFGPPFGCKSSFPASPRPMTTFMRSLEPSRT